MPVIALQPCPWQRHPPPAGPGPPRLTETVPGTRRRFGGCL